MVVVVFTTHVTEEFGNISVLSMCSVQVSFLQNSAIHQLNSFMPESNTYTTYHCVFGFYRPCTREGDVYTLSVNRGEWDTLARIRTRVPPILLPPGPGQDTHLPQSQQGPGQSTPCPNPWPGQGIPPQLGPGQGIPCPTPIPPPRPWIVPFCPTPSLLRPQPTPLPLRQEMPQTGYGTGGTPLAFSHKRTFLLF